MPNPNRIIENLKDEFEKNSSVLALVLIGSQARKTIYKANQYSDLESLVIVKDEDVLKVEQGLPKLVTKFGTVLFSFKHDIGLVAVYDDLFRIELPVIKLSEMKSVFSRPKQQEIKILIDKTNGQLEKILAKRPESIDYEKLFKEKVVNFWYWQIIGVQYFKKGEIYNTRAILNIHASSLIKLFELLNDPKLLLLETNKRVEEFLTNDQLKKLKDITPGYHKYEIKKALNIAMNIFPTVFDQVKNKYGYSYDENIEKKVKSRILELFAGRTCVTTESALIPLSINTLPRLLNQAILRSTLHSLLDERLIPCSESSANRGAVR